MDDHYRTYTITQAENLGNRILIRYNGRLFQGILIEMLPRPELVEAIRPGATIRVKLLQEGLRDAIVSHMQLRDEPSGEWIDLYVD